MKRLIILSLTMMLLFCGCEKDADNNSKIIDADIEHEIAENESTEENKEEVMESDTNVEQSSLKNKVIVIDAGHGISSYNKQEPIAPNSSETKIAFSSGTSGAHLTEEQLNLAVALKLQKVLIEKGAVVHMTRTEHESDMTNVDRAIFANELKADISVRIHADGNNNSSIHGVSVLVPGNKYISDDVVLEKSKLAGESVLSEFVKETGAVNRGIIVRTDLTGFNWTEVPVILVEMGFMSNPDEDKLMETKDYQNKMVQGMVRGLELYFNNN